MDLLESGDEREPVRLSRLVAARLPGWAVAVVAAGVALVLPASLVTAVAVDRSLEREAARPEVEVRVVDSTSSTVSGVARGALELLLVNRGVDEVVVELVFLVDGLQVTASRPEPLGALQPGAEREVRVAYVVPSCGLLVLPGRLLLALESERQRVERVLPVVDPEVGRPSPDAIPLAACPLSARSALPGTPTDLGARSAGGSAERVGAGAAGSARLEIRNGGPPVRLLSVSAHVPGALFVSRLLDGGLTLDTDELALVALRFSVQDCDRLEKTGALLIRVERFGGVQELRLPVSSGLTESPGPEVDLRVVLDACD